jgi:very-short-patch-repair endonuclease
MTNIGSASSHRDYLRELTERIDEPGVIGRLVLWIKFSSGRMPEFDFVHDHSLAGYVIDFYCPSIKLGIDVVPSSERPLKSTDATRRSVLEAHGVVLLSFTEEEITEYTEDVLEHIQILVMAFGRMSQTG